MHKITVYPDNKTLEIENDASILETTLKNGIPHVHVCGGKARCSTCRVIVLEGLENCSPRNEKECSLKNKLNFPDEVRLSCQTKVTGDVTVRRLVVDEDDITLVNQEFKDKTDGINVIGREVEIVSMFLDIRNFTKISEALLPYDVVHILNKYYSKISPIIEEFGGEINNYIGDGLLVLFPQDKDHYSPIDSIRCALKILDEVDQLKTYFESVYSINFEIGIAQNFGNVVRGLIGVQGQKRDSVIGDTINFTSRIETFNKELKTRYLISNSLYEKIEDMVVTGKTTSVPIRGKTGNYNIYEIVNILD